jgi:hypothetical protein
VGDAGGVILFVFYMNISILIKSLEPFLKNCYFNNFWGVLGGKIHLKIKNSKK